LRFCSILPVIVYHPTDTVFQKNYLKVDEEADRDVEEAEVGE
jgi:hypothetical protein